MQRAALRAARIIVDPDDLVGSDRNHVAHCDRDRSHAPPPVLDRGHARDAASGLDDRFELAALQWRAEAETVGVKKTGGAVGEFPAAKRF